MGSSYSKFSPGNLHKCRKVQICGTNRDIEEKRQSKVNPNWMMGIRRTWPDSGGGWKEWRVPSYLWSSSERRGVQGQCTSSIFPPWHGQVKVIAWSITQMSVGPSQQFLGVTEQYQGSPQKRRGWGSPAFVGHTLLHPFPLQTCRAWIRT
jgi:hypothetical protein